MTTITPMAAAVTRRRRPGALLAFVVAVMGTALLGGLAGLGLALPSAFTGKPAAAALQQLGVGLLSGALWGGGIAAVLVGLHYAIWALLCVGRRVLYGAPAVNQTPASGATTVANRPASSYVAPGCAGTIVGLVLGLIGGGVLGFVAVLVWIIVDTTDPMMAGMAPGVGVIFGILWGLPGGALVGALAGAVTGFVAGFRIANYRETPLPAA